MIHTANAFADAVRSMSRINQVEGMSRRMARGLPPVEPQPPAPLPPTPEQQLGNVLQPHQIEAVANAIQQAPEGDRGKLISEAHDSLTRWITTHQGKVVIDGRLHLARTPEQAATLAATILNREVDARDRAAQPATPAAQSNRTGGDQPGEASAAQTDPASSATSPSPENTPRPPLQPSANVGQLQQAASENAPTLAQHLENAVADVPGAEVSAVRDAKDPERLQEKLADRSPEEVSDYLAGRITVNSPEDKEQVVANLKQAAPVIQDDDNFEDGGKNGFHSHNLQLGVSPALSAEVQVLPREQAEIAAENHPAYERQRTAAAEGDTETADRLGQELEQRNHAAMGDFHARAALERAGLRMVGQPIKIGGRTFLAIEGGGGEAGSGEMRDLDGLHVDDGDGVHGAPVSQPLPEDERSDSAQSGSGRDSAQDDQVHATDSTTNEADDVQWDTQISQGVPGSTEDREAAPPESETASPAQSGTESDDEADPARAGHALRYAKGSAVTLQDGTPATVRYHHPSLDVVRINVGGKNRTVSARELSAAS